MTQTQTQFVGLIGWPVEHSVSPAMHSAAFGALGLDWRYVALPTEPAGLETTIVRLREIGFRGANVTVPHKQAVMSSLDEITPDARAIGAVNTIIVQDGKLVGHNTDSGGFLGALQGAGFEPAGRRALVLGAGGAARAVAYALAQAGSAIVVCNRTAQRAAELAHRIRSTGIGVHVGWASYKGLAGLPLSDFDLLVNATSVGMWPKTDASPWPPTLPIPSRWTVFDLVYNPVQTRLLAQARAAGATPIDGLEMLVRQGAEAFRLWTGLLPPTEAMRAAARRAVESMSRARE